MANVDNLIQKLQQEASKLKGAPASVSPTADREFTQKSEDNFTDSAEVPTIDIENVDTEKLQIAKDYVDLGKIPAGLTQEQFEMEFAPEIEMAKSEQTTFLTEGATKEGDPELISEIDKFSDEPVLKTVDDKGNLKDAPKEIAKNPKKTPKK